MLAVTIQVTYDSALLELSDITAGTSVTNALLASNTATPGTATIAVALPETLESEGELLKLVFTAKPGTGGTSNVAITATANEGSPELDLTNGQIRIGEDATVTEWSLFNRLHFQNIHGNLVKLLR